MGGLRCGSQLERDSLKSTSGARGSTRHHGAVWSRNSAPSFSSFGSFSLSFLLLFVGASSDEPCSSSSLLVMIRDYAPNCIGACPAICTPLEGLITAVMMGADPIEVICPVWEIFSCMGQEEVIDFCTPLLDAAKVYAGIDLPRSDSELREACHVTTQEAESTEEEAEEEEAEEPSASQSLSAQSGTETTIDSDTISNQTSNESTETTSTQTRTQTTATATSTTTATVSGTSTEKTDTNATTTFDILSPVDGDNLTATLSNSTSNSTDGEGITVGMGAGGGESKQARFKFQCVLSDLAQLLCAFHCVPQIGSPGSTSILTENSTTTAFDAVFLDAAHGAELGGQPTTYSYSCYRHATATRYLSFPHKAMR